MLLTESNKIINGLWIGEKLSKIELLTIASFINHGHDFHLWTYDTIVTPLPEKVTLRNANEIIPREKIFRYKNKNQFGHGKGSLAGFSDIFRYKLLYEKGGWWVDMDVTCLKPFEFAEPYIFRTHQSLLVVGNMMKCPPHTELMKECFEKANNEVDENNTDWHKPIEILAEGVKKYKLENYIKNISNLDSWQLVRKLLINKKHVNPDWYAIHWVNEEFRRNKINKEYFFKNSTIYDLMQQNKIEINSELINWKIKFINQIRLSWIVAAVNQFPSFLRNRIDSALFHLKK